MLALNSPLICIVFTNPVLADEVGWEVLTNARIMKNKIKFHLLVLLLLCIFSACSKGEQLEGQNTGGGTVASDQPFDEVMVGDFESEKTSPYFFRFGNKGNVKEGVDYLPRWNYAYEVVDNPVQGDGNRSAHVLSYRSMEAQNYGVKILFPESVSVKGLRNISFKIYQPENVMGKATWLGSASASRQRLGVKLLSAFNTINDFKQDEGLLLEDAILDFTQENAWLDCRLDFNPEEISSWKLELFKEGVLGLAIMPTYGAGVTLAENSIYQCYIDDIMLNKE